MSTPSAEQEGKAAAAKFRRDYGLGLQPLTDLVALIETSLDIDVAVLEVETNGGEHGLTMFDPKSEATFIGVAKTNHPMRQRSTLAHELSHAIFCDWVDFQQSVPVVREFRETRADAFARHLLVPEDSLQWFLRARTAGQISLSDLSSVVQTFLVSPAIASIALCSAGLINTQTKTAWMALRTPRLATQFGWLDQYRTLQADSSRTRAPQRLLTRAIRGYEQGVITVETVASIRGVPASEVKAELDAAGIVPKAVEPELLRVEDLPAIESDRFFLEALDELDDPDEPLSERIDGM
ncbi:Zn-dependent peptidase ImmA (M78 family) [Arthrobacter stackebrandtii]|uniref:Zn-dependent peptidase ImmA (M78 family) n=1 Tax=Arthrobacter stackebrandtii TaxID=272161 RepID=A0ABS4YU26_9MICC|nr:ImmA/IrrE family metallo-endopeptidase [Arthrobacter stackebrandtii]MBP2412281.1 Zn-dependent peptidase ImmA (M78 family) [Arthrobacter stackebrandtii]PYH02064.1 toxin-antitoxin system, toxin component [Arthrobacter stackebrandtii]